MRKVTGRLALPLALTALLLSVVAAVFFGSVRLSGTHILQSLLAGPNGTDGTESLIVWSLRLPRILLAAIVGGGLAVVGVAMQALVRNPLADPYVLGISSGAAAGASLFYMGFLPAGILSVLTMPIAAFLGGLITIILVFVVARTDGSVSIARLLLAGVALSALMASIASFVTFSSPDPNRVRGVLFWLLGSFSGARWNELLLPAATCLLGTTVLFLLSRPLDALLLGEDAAQSLGIDVERLKKLLFALCALMTGFLVAAAGTIGFVGLIVPHGVRSVVGIGHRRVVPLAFLTGAVFMVWADVLSSSLLRPVEFPVGVVTAMAGVPFFLILLRASRYQFG